TFSDCCNPNNHGPSSTSSSVCIETTNFNCIATGTPSLSSDEHSISIPIKSPLADGKYVVAVRTFSKDNCPDRTVQNAATWPGCPASAQYNDIVRIPGSGTPAAPFVFTVD